MKGQVAFCVLVILLILSVPFLPLHDEGEIYENTLRLHVKANSDREEDQELKLKVRDAVLERTEEMAKNAKNKEESQKLFSENIDIIRQVAEETVEENGYSYPVTVSLGEEYFPEKTYNDVTLPEGRYTALRVNIGEAEGQNWWCVLFPPLCVSSAQSKEELAEAGFTPNQVRILTDGDSPTYKVRFRILEWAQEISEMIRKNK